MQTCSFFSENAAIRVLMKGKWQFECTQGLLEVDAGEQSRILYFGPQTRILPLLVTGPFRFVQIEFRPGLRRKDTGLDAAETLDRVLPFDHLVPEDRHGSFFDEADGRERWLDTFEALTRTILQPMVASPPPPIVLAFEEMVLADPDFEIGHFLAEHHVSRRTLERKVAAAYGLSPLAVIRRARALDIAAALLGVAMPEEEAEFRLRFFDQAHLTKQIRRYFGMSPGQLAKAEAHLLRIDLEIRQIRRVAARKALGITQVPWRSTAAPA